MVYPFSCHNYDLRYWLAAAGIDPDNDVNLVVVPPPLLAESLKAGRVDGFCVGAAVEQRRGRAGARRHRRDQERAVALQPGESAGCPRTVGADRIPSCSPMSFVR